MSTASRFVCLLHVLLCVASLACLAAGLASGAVAAETVAALQERLAQGVPPGTTVDVDGQAGPWSGDVVVTNLRGTAGQPIVLRGSGAERAVIHGKFHATGAAHLVLERLAFEPSVAGEGDGPWVSLDGEHIELRDCAIRSTPGDGLRLRGAGNGIAGGEFSACEGYGLVLDGSARVNGVRVTACRQGGLHVGGEVTVSNCLLLHNRGSAILAEHDAALRCYHNLVYDNGGGLILDACRSARVLNNLLLNNYATPLLSDRDVELSVRHNAEIDHNIYFRHPGKDKLLRGLPYAQGVDLSPLASDNPQGLRLRVVREGEASAAPQAPTSRDPTARQEPRPPGPPPPVPSGGRYSAIDRRWLEKFDAHSLCLDILQRLTGENSYTRCYEDLFADFQQEDFRPRYTSPAVGRGADLTAEVPTDVAGQPRSARHPDIGPYAAPATWWADLDSGRATIVDGGVGLDAQGRDCGRGTPDQPFATLAKALALARWGSRIYVRDAIYRHTAMQTTFSLGPEAVVSGVPGHRPTFSPSEFIATSRWEEVSGGSEPAGADARGDRSLSAIAGQPGLYRLRDWHTFLGYTCRANAWVLDYYGNARVGGAGENATSLSRNLARVGDPFRPIRYLTLDRDTPQVLVDGVALQPAGGVLGLEEFSIGTMSAWGRDVGHLRPGSFMVGRRDFLVSRAVGHGTLQDGQTFLEGPNRDAELNYRIDGHATGYVSAFVARPAALWQARHTYPGGDHLWQLDPAVIGKFGQTQQRLLQDGWRQVAANQDSACWVRPFALPAWELKPADGPALRRAEGRLHRDQLPLHGWLQRQFQTGDAALAAVLDNPYQDYLEVRLPQGVDPNRSGLTATCFTGRVEAVWRKSVPGEYHPGVNQPGLAMLSHFRTLEAGVTAAATAATATQPWQFGCLVPLGESVPTLLMRMPADVDPNVEDPWKFTVVDDCLYVQLPPGDSPADHAVEVACHSGSSVSSPVGSNPSFFDWQDAGPLRPDWPAVRVYRTDLDFGSNRLEPLWSAGGPMVGSPGFQLDASDPTGRTLRLLAEVRLDADDPPGGAGEKTLIIRYSEGDPASPTKREHRVSSQELGPDRRIVLPSQPIAFDSRYAFCIAPATEPGRMTEQSVATLLRLVSAKTELAQGTYYYDASGHGFYVCPFPGSEPIVSRWVGGRSDPMHLVRGLYTLGGNAYGHQKQYCWGCGLGMPADVYEDVTAGFSPGHTLSPVPGTVVRNCTFRWCGADVGRGGEVSGDERHTADRIKRPELHVDHCIFDVGNAFLFDGNDSPTKNIPFGNHHLWEHSYFLPAMVGMMGPWWDQYCFNNVVQNCVFAGRGGVDVEVSENLIVRNNLFTTDKGNLVTFRGSDRGYVLNNTTFRGGGIWYHSEPERANSTEQGQPTYGPPRPIVERGPVPWLTIDQIGHEKSIRLDVRWLPLADHAEVFYCENWDFPSPLLIDAQGVAAYRAVSSLAELQRGCYFHDPSARRLYLRQTDGSSPQSTAVPAPHIPQTEQVRRDLVYTLTVVRPGRLSIPYQAISRTELEVLEPLQPGETVEVWYYESPSRGREGAGPTGHPAETPPLVLPSLAQSLARRVERFPISAGLLKLGRPRLRLSGVPVDERLFVGRAGEQPPLVRVTGSWKDVRPFEAELLPGGSLVASAVMGLQFNIRRGYFPQLQAGEQFESVLHSRSVYHLSSLNNVFLDVRSTVASDAMDNMHHGANYLLYTEQTDPSHSQLDYNCYWKDLRAVPGPLSAHVQWGQLRVWNSTSSKEGITLPEFHEKTGYEGHGLSPASYFTLVANPLRYDFRPLPDSPLLGTGVVTKQQVGAFLFDPDAENGQQRFTYPGNERDAYGQPRGDRPSMGAVQQPCRGAQAYYLAPDGADAPDRGTRQAPWATAAYALARLRPGDLLVLRPGTYRQPIVVRRSGTPRDFLHIVAENPPYETPAKFPTGGATILDAAGLDSRPAVLLDGCAHVRVAGLRVLHSTAPAAVELRETRDCVVEYAFVERPAGAGIRVTGRGNTLYECHVAGGMAGYELAGSLTDVRWCVSHDNATGFRAIGPLAGLLLLQNRHHGGERPSQTGFDLSGPASDLVLDGNWVDSANCGYRLGGRRVLLANNQSERTDTGIHVTDGADVRLFNNSVLRAAQDGLVLGEEVRSALVLNNVLQAERSQLVAPPAVWADYNLYSRASLPFQLNAQLGDRSFSNLAAWSAAAGWDRNSRVAPLVYFKQQDRNGRWRVREACISVSNLTPHYNVGPLGANADPYAGGGTYILDLPQNWKPHGDPARRVYVFDVEPEAGALAARAYWYVARVDYRRNDGSRAVQDLYRVYLPPEQLPAGAFHQEASTGRVYVRLPADAQEPCPIGKHLQLRPSQAVGYYVGRAVTGVAEKYRGKLIGESLAQALVQAGIQELDVVANCLSCVCGSPTFERGCPILGLCRDADSCPRPAVPLGLSAFGAHGGPGRFDVGAAEHGYYVP